MIVRKFRNYFHTLGSVGGRQLLLLFILAAADVFIYLIPYYIRSFLPNMQAWMHISEEQYQWLLSILGWSTLITLLPGGILADRVSPRILSATALFTTSLLIVVWIFLIRNGAAINPHTLMVMFSIIYFLWGITTIMLFWSPLWKLVAQQAKTPRKLGLVNGIQGTFNGLIGIFFVWIGGILVAYSGTATGNNIGLIIYASIVAIILTIIAILLLLLVEEVPRKPRIGWQSVRKLLRSRRVWLMGIGGLGMYVFQGFAIGYLLIQIFVNVFHLPPSTAAILGGINLYVFRMLISKTFGHYADRHAKSYVWLTVVFSLLTSSLLAVMIILMPTSAAAFATYSSTHQWIIIGIFIALFLTGSICVHSYNSIKFAQTTEIPQPRDSYGSIVAVISAISFSPDSFFFGISATVARNNLDGHVTSAWGYTLMLIIVLAFMFIGFLSCALLYWINHREVIRLGKTTHRWRLDRSH